LNRIPTLAPLVYFWIFSDAARFRDCSALMLVPRYLAAPLPGRRQDLRVPQGAYQFLLVIANRGVRLLDRHFCFT
jgi:hypothetical protein